MKLILRLSKSMGLSLLVIALGLLSGLAQANSPDTLEASFAGIWSTNASAPLTYYLDQVNETGKRVKLKQVLVQLSFLPQQGSRKLHIEIRNAANDCEILKEQFTAETDSDESLFSSVRLFRGGVGPLEFVVSIAANGEVSARVWTGVVRAGEESLRRQLKGPSFYGWASEDGEKLEGATLSEAEAQMTGLNFRLNSLASQRCAEVMPEVVPAE